MLRWHAFGVNDIFHGNSDSMKRSTQVSWHPIQGLSLLEDLWCVEVSPCLNVRVAGLNMRDE